MRLSDILTNKENAKKAGQSVVITPMKLSLNFC